MKTARLLLGAVALSVLGYLVGRQSAARSHLDELAHARIRHNEEVMRLVRERETTAHAAAIAKAELDALRQRQTAAGPPAVESAIPQWPPKSPSPAPTSLPRPATTIGSAPKPDRVAEKQRLHQRYDAFLLGQRGLTPQQADRFVELKLAIYAVQDDLQSGVAANGLRGDAAGVEALRAQFTKPLWNEIQQMLGPDGYAAYHDYERTSAYRIYGDTLFKATGALPEAQALEFARIIQHNDQPVRASPSDIGMRSRVDWGAVMKEAEPLLTPAQAAALKAYATRQPTP